MTRDASLEERRPDAAASLEWLRGLLWPGAVEVGVRGPGAAAPGERTWWILPSADDPELLVPVGSAAGSSLRQFNDAMPAGARLRKAAVGEALRLGAGRMRGLRRLGARGGRDGLLGAVLPGVFGVPEVAVAISIGRALRPNRKPVLQVMTPRGRVLGYAKIGWNDVTRSLIDAEARTLRAWAVAPPSTFRVPAVVHDGDWEHLRVLVLSAVPHPLLRRRAGTPGAAVLREVASLGGIITAPLAGSAYVARLAERLTALGPSLPDGTTTTFDGERPIPLGTWHGDWAPWNMSTVRGRLHVWDWERSSAEAPVGLDAMHRAFEVAYHKRSASPAGALSGATEDAAAVLSALGLSTDLDAVRRVYVLERLARLEEGRAAGVPTDERLRAGLRAWLGSGG